MNLGRCTLMAVLAISACAPVLKPAALVDAEELLASRQFHEAAPLAPQAASHARQLDARATEALQKGDRSRAELLAQLTAAAVHRTVVLARLARAEQRAAHAELSLSAEGQKLRELQAQRAELNQDIKTLEVRAKVLRDALPLTASEPATPKRQAARTEAARALATQARLLCLASQLIRQDVDPPASALQQRLGQLEARLEIETPATGQNAPTPRPPSASSSAEAIDEAVAVRAACLKQLTFVRREQASAHPESSPADALLTELSESALSPVRDDRGVVVTLALEPTAPTRGGWNRSLAQLAEAAKRYPQFPLLLVLHTSLPASETALLAKAVQARQVLHEQGVGTISVASAGNRIPVALPSDGNRARNERLEVVFVVSTQ